MPASSAATRCAAESRLREANEAKKSKPAPDIFLYAASGVRAAPQCCYVIEDSFNGIRSASAAGMTPVMVPDLLQPDPEIRSIAAAILPDLVTAGDWILADALRRGLLP